MTSQKPKLWTSSFIAVFLTNLFTAHAFYILLACMPVFVVNELKLDESYAGLVMGVFSITGVLARIFAGALLDSLGRLGIFRLGVGLFTLCTFGYAAAGSFVSLIMIRLAHGGAWGLTSTSSFTLAADIVPPARRAEGLGYYSMTMSIGMALGPALGTMLIGVLSFVQIFILCTILSVLALVTSFLVKVPPYKKKQISFKLSALIEKRVGGISLMFVFFGMSYGSIMSFVILYGQKLNISHSGLYFMIFALLTAIVRPATGRYFDKFGPGNMMGGGFLSAICAMLFLAYATGPLFYFSSAILMGFGAGIIMAFLTAMAMNVIPPERRGATNATIFTAFDGGIGVGSVVFGLLASAFNINAMYICSAVVLVIPLVYYYIWGLNSYNRLLSQMKG